MPLGLRFSLLHRSYKKKIDELLREKDLTGVQFFVLGALVRLEHAGSGEIHQRDLELATHVTHPTMTELLKRLEKKGLIRCAPSARFKMHFLHGKVPRSGPGGPRGGGRHDPVALPRPQRRTNRPADLRH